MRVLKCIWILILMMAMQPSFGQSRVRSFHDIDWEVQYINALSPDSLAYKLSSPYRTELEKVRAIFSWMTRNIAYNTGILRPRSQRIKDFIDVDFPDSVAWKSANEMTAYQVMRRRVAVCEGYAKLFATLCEYAGIKSEVVTGYARCCPGYSKFRTNHSWNAVRIDSNWHLLDVTWGSGYVNQWDEFVQRTDENYFLARPDRFVQDHFPDDLRWTLLEDIPAMGEFKRTPFMNKAFVKYNISTVSHQKGLIEASVGDTIRVEILLHDRKRDETISPDPFFDSAVLFSSPRAVFVDPELKGNRAIYKYIVQSPGIEWLHLIYNEDIVLRYRLNIKNESVAAVLNER